MSRINEKAEEKKNSSVFFWVWTVRGNIIRKETNADIVVLDMGFLDIEEKNINWEKTNLPLTISKYLL